MNDRTKVTILSNGDLINKQDIVEIEEELISDEMNEDDDEDKDYEIKSSDKATVMSQCKECPKYFINDAFMLKHMRLTHFTCCLCNTGFDNTANLKAHIIQIHGKGFTELLSQPTKNNTVPCQPPNLNDSSKPRCRLCDKVPDDLILHVQNVHHCANGLVCPYCDKVLTKNSTLNRHIEQVHLNIQLYKPVTCNYCSKLFSKKGHLERHVKNIHMGIKDVSEPCPFCGKIFTSKSSLEPHIEMVHKGVKKKCTECGKVLSDIWKHMRTVHGYYRRKLKIVLDETSNKTTSTMKTASSITG